MEDLTEYLEIHYDIVEEFCNMEARTNLGEDNLIGRISFEHGRGGLYELAKDLTDKFTEKYKDVIWGEELEYQDTMVEFLKENLYEKDIRSI